MMLTRCPRCQTLFRVTPEQLKARQGRVRCGHCQTVFDALEALEEEGLPMVAAGPVAAAPVDAARELAAPAPNDAPLAEPPVPPANDAAAAEAETLIADEPPPPTEAAEPEPEPEAESEPAAEESDNPPDELGLEPLLHEEEAPPRRAWLWVLGILAALLILAFQAVLQLRVELAILYPSAKPTLQALCNIVGCDIPLPRKIDLIGIETSDLHPDPSGDGRLLLVASLRNRAPFVQPYPHLEVTLTDVADHALIRRVFAPAEYLPAEAAKAGFAVKGDQPLSLLLDAPGVPAVGYRLYVFYP